MSTPNAPTYFRAGRARLVAEFARLVVIVLCLAVTVATYLVVVLIRGYAPTWSDLVLAVAIGPAALLISVWAGTEEWRYRMRSAGAR